MNLSSSPTLSVRLINLPGRIHSTQPMKNGAGALMEGNHTLIVGDSHAGFGNLLIYADKILGNLNLPEETAKSLDELAQSSYIEQLEMASNKVKYWEKQLTLCIELSLIHISQGIVR